MERLDFFARVAKSPLKALALENRPPFIADFRSVRRDSRARANLVSAHRVICEVYVIGKHLHPC